MSPARCHEQVQWVSFAVANCVQFRVRVALGASDQAATPLVVSTPRYPL